MIGLDSSVLLALFHGEKGTGELLRSLEGEELATTELNLLELRAIALRSSPKIRASRQDLVHRLRQKLTIVPIDFGGVLHKFSKAEGPATAGELLEQAMIAAMEAHGCSRWITKGPRPKGRWKLRIFVLP